MKRSSPVPWKQPALLWLLQAVLYLPFLFQAFHMDDPIYLDIGRNALLHPWEPHDFPYGFTGYAVKDMASHSHPPFNGYYIALWMWILGNTHPPSWIMHLAFLPFALLFTTAMFFLARRFVAEPVTASVLAIAGPAAVVLSHTLMSDYPTLALWTAGLTLFIYGSERDDKLRLSVAAVCLSLAAFASYPALWAALLCWLYLYLHRSPSRAAWCVPAVPFLFMALWLGKSSLYYGRFILAATARYTLQETHSFWASLGEKGVTLPVLVAGALVISLPLIVKVLLLWQGRLAILLAMAGICVAQTGTAVYPWPEKILFAILFWLGMLTLTGLALLIYRNPDKDALFLGAWLGGAAAIAIGLYTSASPRYLLPMVPPLALLSMKICEWSGHRWYRRLNYAGALLSVMLALVFSLADYAAAAVYRRMGEEAKKIFAGWEGQVRFGGEWGFRHAMETNGYRQFLTVSDDFHGGDFILTPDQATPYTLPQDVESMAIELGSQEYLSSFPVQLMCRQVRAGFYSSGWGWLPFGFYRGPTEKLHLRQVSLLSESMPEAVIRCSSGKPALPVPPLEGLGIDLRLEGDCRISFPLPVAPASQLLLQTVVENRPETERPDLRISLRAQERETGDLLSVVEENPSRYLVKLPATKAGDRLEMEWTLSPKESPGVIRLHNLVRLPDPFPWGGAVHVD